MCVPVPRGKDVCPCAPGEGCVSLCPGGRMCVPVPRGKDVCPCAPGEGCVSLCPEGCLPQEKEALPGAKDALPKAKGCIPPGMLSPKPRDALPKAGTRIPPEMPSLGPRDALPTGDAPPRAEGCPAQSPGMLPPGPRGALPMELSFPKAPAPSLGGLAAGSPREVPQSSRAGREVGDSPIPLPGASPATATLPLHPLGCPLPLPTLLAAPHPPPLEIQLLTRTSLPVAAPCSDPSIATGNLLRGAKGSTPGATIALPRVLIPGARGQRGAGGAGMGMGSNRRPCVGTPAGLEGSGSSQRCSMSL
nr:basic proline-rich protein-like [Taeniopygia guttata]